MKSSIFLVFTCLTALSIFAQHTVTITVNGNRNREVLVDGTSYPIDNASVSGTNRKVITINDLQPGQHRLELIRSNPVSSNRTSSSITSFTLRQGYDVDININGLGSVVIRDVRARNTTDGYNTGEGYNQGYKTPMSNARFSTLLQEISNERNISTKYILIDNAFTNTNNYFTTSQARQLIQSVTSDHSRLQLAKASYRSITDPSNFSQLYDLFNSQQSRNELAEYVRTYNANNAVNTGNVNNNQHRTPMSDANFNALLQDVRNQWLVGAKMSTINEAFANTHNFFTSYQVRQLIQLIDAESNRLQLAKAAYRSITDPNNIPQVYDLLRTQSSKNELADYIAYYNANNAVNTGNVNNNQYRTPMSDASFNSLLQDVQNQWQAGAKMTTINNAFTNVNNYFTAYQVRQLIQLIDSESNRLQLAKAAYRGITDPNDINQIYDLFNTQASRNELAAYVNSYNANAAANNTVTIINSDNRTPMSDASFNALFRDVQNQWQAGAKMTTINNAFTNTNNYFTTYQVRQLIQLIDEEGNRLQLAKTAYRGITDPNNMNQIYDLFNTQASRDELASYIASYNRNNQGTNNNVVVNSQNKTPMSDASFRALYDDIQRQWIPGSKLNALTNAFANPNNYFTSSQAKQLIQLTSDEMNRLQLAKASYRNITDPANFSQLYDLFSIRANRESLEAYVANFAYTNANQNKGYGQTKVPMSNADFNAIYRNIQNQWIPGAKMTALRNTFTNPDYYFTTSQSKQLIQLERDEDDRLQLAKLSYRNITDRENFPQLYDILISRASRDELARYVRDYRD